MENITGYIKIGAFLMDNELLSSFLTTLKAVNAALLELTKVTARNEMAVKILVAVLLASIGSGFSIICGLILWIVKIKGGV